MPGPDWHVAGCGPGTGCGQGALLATVGQGIGWVGNSGRNRVLRVASGPQPSSVPVLWVARPRCPHLPSALYLGPPLPPRLLAPRPSSEMTQDDAVLGGRQGWDTHFPFWPLPHSSNHHQPPPPAPRVPGQRQPCTFCPAWGPNCTGIYFLTHLPFSRCGLLGKGSCVLEPDTCMAGCDAESGLAGVGMGCEALLQSKHTDVFSTTIKRFFFSATRGVPGI